MRELIIGTGFYANPSTLREKAAFLRLWLANTRQPHERVIIFDNSATGIPDGIFRGRVIRSTFNLGHCGESEGQRHKFTGWSMSWIIPALLAYSDNCDFIYKEQDCLAFGNWLSQVRSGRAAFGNNDVMECENSLFYIERDFIPEFAQAFMALPGKDAQFVVEAKFKALEQSLQGVGRFSMGVGRNRPLPADLHARPWYAQRLTHPELNRIATEGLI